MKVELSNDGRRLTLIGALTENDELLPWARRLAGEVELDLAGITRINSSGVKHWLNFVRAVQPGVALRFTRAPAGFMQQVNSIRDFLGSGTLVSFVVPYLCESCGAIDEPVVTAAELGDAAAPSTRPCAQCGAAQELDVPPDEYFAFLHRP